MRKKILEHSWLELEKHESNPTQTWRRIRDEMISAIDDIILLAQKLPEDKQKEIFTPSKIDSLIENILYIGDRYPYSDIFNSRKAELAARLVERGIDLNSYQYRLLNKDTLSLVEPTINHLKQSVSICKDIARKLEIKKIEEEAEQTELVYLFSWNKMFREEKGRLQDYIVFNKTGEDLAEILESTIKRINDKKIECNFGMKTGLEKEPELIFGTISIIMNDTKTAADLRIFDSYDNMTHQNELVVKPANNYSNDVNLFEKNKGNRKRRQ